MYHDGGALCEPGPDRCAAPALFDEIDRRAAVAEARCRADAAGSAVP